jgi:hypothetical protein
MCLKKLILSGLVVIGHPLCVEQEKIPTLTRMTEVESD